MGAETTIDRDMVYRSDYDEVAAKLAAAETIIAEALEYASRLGRIDSALMIEKLGGTVEPREEEPLQIQCRRCHALFGRRVDDAPTFDIQANPLGVVRFRRTRNGFAPCCPECGEPRQLY